MTEQRQPIASEASPEQPEHARTRRHRSRHRSRPMTVPWWRRRRTFVLLGALAALGLVLVVGAIRYSTLVHDALALRDSMDRLTWTTSRGDSGRSVTPWGAIPWWLC